MATFPVPAGTSVTIARIPEISPLSVLNGRTGVVRVDGHSERHRLVSIHLDYPISRDEVALMYGDSATLADASDDGEGYVIKVLARMLDPKADLLDPDGPEARKLVTAVISEIRGMARRTSDEVWKILRDEFDADRIARELPYAITTEADARAWVQQRAYSDAFGY